MLHERESWVGEGRLSHQQETKKMAGIKQERKRSRNPRAEK